MKQEAIARNTTILIFVAVIVSACASTRRKENALSSSGFKIISPNTAAQKAQLKSLPTSKVVMIQKDGKPYFMFPDVAKNRLYVGDIDQYQAYRALRGRQSMASEKYETEFPTYPTAQEWSQNNLALIEAPAMYEGSYKVRY